jgi:hypothetical protein
MPVVVTNVCGGKADLGETSLNVCFLLKADIGDSDLLRRNFSLKTPLRRTRECAGDAIATRAG